MRQLDVENNDYDLTLQQTVLTHTPDASNPCLCQGLVCFGDGSKDLDGTGGDFELTVVVGGQTLEPDPQEITFSAATRTAVFTRAFPVPANAQVLLKAKSPNGADTDVDVTAYLYDVGPLQPTTRGNQLTVSGGAALVAGQAVRDSMKLAPTAGAPAVGSIDKHLDDILEDTDELQASIGAPTIE